MVAAHIHRGCLARGHQSVVWTSGSGHSDPGVRPLARSAFGFLAKLPFWAIQTRAFDLVHCHVGETFPLLLAIRVLRVRTPLLVTFHVDNRQLVRANRGVRLAGELVAAPRQGRLTSWMKAQFERLGQWLMLRLSDQQVFIAKSTAEQLLGVERAAQAHIVHNGIPSDAMSSVSASPCELLFVGTEAVRKRSHALPLILERIRQQVPSARLRVLGFEVPGNHPLRLTIQGKGLQDAVELAGKVAPAELAAHYRSAKLLLLPSTYEGLPMVILEAGLQQLPTVAARVCGHPEVIDDGVNGYLVEADDFQGFADRCVALLQDEPRRVAMGRAIREKVTQDFGLDRCLDAYLAIYKSMQRRPMR